MSYEIRHRRARIQLHERQSLPAPSFPGSAFLSLPTGHRLAWWIVGSLWGLFILLVLFPVACSDSLTYVPSSGERVWTSTAQLNGSFNPPNVFQEINLTTRRGDPLVCLYLPKEKPRATILLLHGANGNASSHGLWMHYLEYLGVDILAVDYPGYGKSGGRPSERGCIDAVQAGYNWLVRVGRAPKNIVVVGHSLGGGLAVELASRESLGGLVVINSFTSIREVAKSHLPGLPWHHFMNTSLDSKARIPYIKTPSVFIGSALDRIIPPEQMTELGHLSTAPKQEIMLVDAEHDFVMYSHVTPILKAIDALIDEHIAPDDSGVDFRKN